MDDLFVGDYGKFMNSSRTLYDPQSWGELCEEEVANLGKNYRRKED